MKVNKEDYGKITELLTVTKRIPLDLNDLNAEEYDLWERGIFLFVDDREKVEANFRTPYLRKNIEELRKRFRVVEEGGEWFLELDTIPTSHYVDLETYETKREAYPYLKREYGAEKASEILDKEMEEEHESVELIYKSTRLGEFNSFEDFKESARNREEWIFDCFGEDGYTYALFYDLIKPGSKSLLYEGSVDSSGTVLKDNTYGDYGFLFFKDPITFTADGEEYELFFALESD